MADTLISAATYVRMSTEHQRYSIDNQSDALAQYAATNGMRIVRTYSDAGKSGLTLEGRSGLTRLLADVQAKTDEFEIILVYDVSRWGRFQDVDEAAHHEYICRKNGYGVEYAAEQFDNDGSPINTIVKGVKRAMAGEYSRELSAKVFAGHCRLAEMGYRQGGKAGYALRRMIVDRNGQKSRLLAEGEEKGLQSDKVVLVPGPDAETRVVRDIYRWFIEDGITEQHIANRLNRAGIDNGAGAQWNSDAIHHILTKEKYIGHNVYAKTSKKLQGSLISNKQDDWVRCSNAYEPIIDESSFFKAQHIIRERCRRWSDEEMIERLKSAYKRYGYLTGEIIDEAADLPNSWTYVNRFGGLMRAYELVGFKPTMDFRYIKANRHLRRLHKQVVQSVIQQITILGAVCTRDAETDLLTFSDEFSASICIARHSTTQFGYSRWKIRFDTRLRPDLTIGVRMDRNNERPFDYYLLPRLEFSQPSLSLADENGLAFDAYRFETLDFVLEMADRKPLKRAA